MQLALQNIFVQSLCALFACVAYGIICNAPRKELLYCGLNGFWGWFVYRLLYIQNENAAIATLMATMAVTAAARFLAYRREAPSILYHIPGILPLVPGTAVYQTMTSAINGQILETYSNALSIFQLAGAIGIGSLLILVLPHWAFAFSPLKKK
ncbi:MAG: threonine/serine exporter family protein [Anaerotignum sp.]|nr:threonine/serine exporter family protein [Anaerotignum sp.]